MSVWKGKRNALRRRNEMIRQDWKDVVRWVLIG